jgi:hypothetical protein
MFYYFIHRELAKALNETQKGAINFSQMEHVITKCMYTFSFLFSFFIVDKKNWETKHC